jgi:hypothetical protein
MAQREKWEEIRIGKRGSGEVGEMYETFKSCYLNVHLNLQINNHTLMHDIHDGFPQLDTCRAWTQSVAP